MTLTIELTPEQEATLQSEAEREGRPLPDYALRVLLSRPKSRGMTGAELIAKMKREDLFCPTYGDPSLDGPTLARKLREELWNRDNVA